MKPTKDAVGYRQEVVADVGGEKGRERERAPLGYPRVLV